MSDFDGFPPRPNLQGYTAVPNVFFDEVLPNINNMSELKVLLAVFRKTYGWVKEIDPTNGQPIYKLEDEISYSQFEKLTGLSSSSVATGLTRAQNNGYLEKTKQGNYTGETSGYRLVTEGERKPEPPKPKQEFKVTGNPAITRMDIGGLDDVDVPKQIKGTSLADITGGLVNGRPAPPKSEKDSLLDEILGSTPTKAEPKEKKSTPHQEFISNWFRLYYTTVNQKYGDITGKEHGHIKSLCREHEIKTILKAMEFYFRNYKNIDGVPQDYPTITVFYAWRKKIIPASEHGIIKQTKGNRNAREFEAEKWTGDDFFDN